MEGAILAVAIKRYQLSPFAHHFRYICGPIGVLELDVVHRSQREIDLLHVVDE